MYILKNAYISITRNKGRNLLIGLIVLVISCVTTVALAIMNSSNALIESYKSQYEVTATLGINRENMRREMTFNREIDEDDESDEDFKRKDDVLELYSDASNVTIEDIEEYGDSSYVKSYYYTMSVGANSDDIEKASMTTNTEDNDNNNDMPDNGFGGRGGKETFTEQASGDFTLIGYSTLEAMEKFISGDYTIMDGEVSLDENVCMINSELATLNDLKVGDEIIFYDSEENNEITLTIVGIFEDSSTDTGDQMSMYTSSVNTVITGTDTIVNYVADNENINVITTPTFVLTSSDVVDDFEQELYDKGMSEYLSVSTNLDKVENATSTISNVVTFTQTFLILTLIIGTIVLFVINMINIRERKYEIGVLRTIGMKKILLSLQFMTELLIVTIFALLIGAGIGALCSVKVSNILLESEISSSESKTEEINNNFGGKDMKEINGIVSIQAFDSIDAAVNIKVILELIGIGVLLTVVSSSCTMISIQKFSPLSILKERS